MKPGNLPEVRNAGTQAADAGYGANSCRLELANSSLEDEREKRSFRVTPSLYAERFFLSMHEVGV